jgi:hypothetical protein
MPKLSSNKCKRNLPVGAHLVKKAFPENSTRKGYFVYGDAPVVKYTRDTRDSAKGCVRSARPYENKRIRQANRTELRQTSALPKKVTPKKVAPKNATTTPKKATATPKKATATPKKATPKGEVGRDLKVIERAIDNLTKHGENLRLAKIRELEEKLRLLEAKAVKAKDQPVKTVKAKAQTAVKTYVPLDEAFVLNYINQTVFAYAFQETETEEWGMVTPGTYYKILGFSDDDENGTEISNTPKQFIVIQRDDNLSDPFTILKNGVIQRGGTRFFVDVPVKIKPAPTYVILDQEFARKNRNSTVLVNFFEKKGSSYEPSNNAGDQGYYKIIGFTNDANYAFDFKFESGFQNIKFTPQNFIVLHEQGNNGLQEPIIIRSNGDAGISYGGLTDSARAYVDTSNERPSYVPLDDNFVNQHAGTFLVYRARKIKNEWKFINELPMKLFIMGFTKQQNPGKTFEEVNTTLTDGPTDFIALSAPDNRPFVITKTGETLNGQYLLYVENPDFPDSF